MRRCYCTLEWTSEYQLPPSDYEAKFGKDVTLSHDYTRSRPLSDLPNRRVMRTPVNFPPSGGMWMKQQITCYGDILSRIIFLRFHWDLGCLQNCLLYNYNQPIWTVSPKAHHLKSIKCESSWLHSGHEVAEYISEMFASLNLYAAYTSKARNCANTRTHANTRAYTFAWVHH